jgi:hypothetical protein
MYKILIVIGVVILAVIGILMFRHPVTLVPTEEAAVVDEANGTVELGLGQKGDVGEVSIMPESVTQDSRCPEDVQCIQAGTVEVRATLTSALGTDERDFTLGEPVTTEAEAVTLVKVTPAKNSKTTIAESAYRFTFKVVPQKLTYDNASADLVTVSTPQPGAVVGKSFSVKGRARGTWYFEASFPVEVLDKDGNRLVAMPAQAEGDWMTDDFVPFSAELTIPDSYVGPATVVLHKDNPSGDPSREASLSFPITVEY